MLDPEVGFFDLAAERAALERRKDEFIVAPDKLVGPAVSGATSPFTRNFSYAVVRSSSAAGNQRSSARAISYGDDGNLAWSAIRDWKC